MKLTKYTHACVRIEDAANTLVIDPGVFNEADTIAGADTVLVTHEHYDHLDVEKLTAALRDNPRLRIITHAEVAPQLDAVAEAVTVVSPGDAFEAGGLAVRAVGGHHADIYDGKPGCANLGFVVETGAGTVYHPGDALHVPDTSIDVLLVPTSGPWLKLAEAIDFTKAVAPSRAYSIHDGLMSRFGLQVVDRWLTMAGETEYARIPDGEAVTLLAARPGAAVDVEHLRGEVPGVR